MCFKIFHLGVVQWVVHKRSINYIIQWGSFGYRTLWLMENLQSCQKSPEKSRETYPPTQLHFFPYNFLSLCVNLFGVDYPSFFQPSDIHFRVVFFPFSIAFLFLCSLFRLAHTPSCTLLRFPYSGGIFSLFTVCLSVSRSMSWTERREKERRRRFSVVRTKHCDSIFLKFIRSLSIFPFRVVMFHSVLGIFAFFLWLSFPFFLCSLPEIHFVIVQNYSVIINGGWWKFWGVFCCFKWKRFERGLSGE